jgi:hypothetical protein
MHLPVYRPALTHLLHAQRRNDSQRRRLEFRAALVDRNVGRDAHLGDEVEVLLVAVIVLVFALCLKRASALAYHSL